jgi:hypothetical protein
MYDQISHDVYIWMFGIFCVHCGAGKQLWLRVPDGRLFRYTVRNDRNLDGVGLKLAENAVTPEGIELIRHLEFLDEKQEYVVEPARQYAGA